MSEWAGGSGGPLGPGDAAFPTEDEINSAVKNVVDQLADKPNAKPGHPEVVTLSGKPRCENYVGPAPCPIDESTGMHKDYWVLSDEERSKGFVRPVRKKYKHNVCGSVTWMADKLAETYAVDPAFYSGTFCVACKKHFPVDQFTWINNDGTPGEVMGT